MDDKEYDLKIESIAYKNMEDMTSDDLSFCQMELALCDNDFLRFLKWVRIVDPPIPGKTSSGIVPFSTPPHVLEFIEALKKETLITLLKARQIYISTTLAAYNLWMSRFRIGANLLLFSKGQPEAKELLSKSHRMYDLLPPFMRIPIDPDSTEELGFPVMQSAVKAFPSTQSAGISYTASLVECDEHAAHPYADENFLSAKPTIDRGAQFVSVFTADPFSNDNLATTIFTDALEKKNGFKALFFPYDVVPGRDQAWYERTKASIPERDLARLSPDLYMAKNYPRSIEEALSLASDIAVFDRKVLNQMMQDVHGSVNVGWPEFDENIVHIYKDFHIGSPYIAGSDVSLGVGGDFGVTCIMNPRTGEIVADVMSKEIPPDKFALESVKLLERYNRPLWWIEHNMYGRTVIRKAIELGYRRLGYRGDKPILWSSVDDTEIKRVGFYTGDASRADLFGSLISAVNSYQLRIYSEPGLRQFFSMHRNVHKGGKIEASSGSHDDYVIAVGICWLKKDDVIIDVKAKCLTYSKP